MHQAGGSPRPTLWAPGEKGSQRAVTRPGCSPEPQAGGASRPGRLLRQGRRPYSVGTRFLRGEEGAADWKGRVLGKRTPSPWQ